MLDLREPRARRATVGDLLEAEAPPRPAAARASRSRLGRSCIDFTTGEVRDERVEWLRSIPAEEYVERLTGQHVGASRKVHCPLHEERSASFHVYPDHWHCFGCHEGRDLFDLASALLGIPARGPDWPVLVDALTEVFR